MVRTTGVNRGNKPVENMAEIAENTPKTQEKPELKRRTVYENPVTVESWDLSASD